MSSEEKHNRRTDAEIFFSGAGAGRRHVSAVVDVDWWRASVIQSIHSANKYDETGQDSRYLSIH